MSNKKMKTISMILVAFMIVATLSMASAETLRLVQKDPTNWIEVYGGKSFTLTYNPEGTDFDYRGDGIVPLSNTGYTLIYYADINYSGSTEIPVTAPSGIVAIKIANNDLEGDHHSDGSIHLEGSRIMDSIPYSQDNNSIITSNGGYPGARLWLVPSEDIVLGNNTVPKTLNWNHYPDGYLFEENLEGAVNGVPSHLITYRHIGKIVLDEGTIDDLPLKFRFRNTGMYFDTVKNYWNFVVNGVKIVTLTGKNILAYSSSSLNPAYSFMDNPTSGVWYDKVNKEIKIAFNGSSKLIVGQDYVKFLNSDFIMPTVKPLKPKAGSTYFNLTLKTTNCYDGTRWYYCGNGTRV